MKLQQQIYSNHKQTSFHSFFGMALHTKRKKLATYHLGYGLLCPSPSMLRVVFLYLLKKKQGRPMLGYNPTAFMKCFHVS